MKYLEACIQRLRYLSTFVCPVDIILGTEEEGVFKLIYSRLKEKLWQTYSQTWGYIKSRVTIVMVCVTH